MGYESSLHLIDPGERVPVSPYKTVTSPGAVFFR